MLSKPGGPRFLQFAKLQKMKLYIVRIVTIFFLLQGYLYTMEFPITPMIIVLFNLIWIMAANPRWNEWIPLSMLADYSKVLIPFVILFILSVGTYIRHYYTKTFNTVYILLQLSSIVMAIYYVITVQNEHL
jgi:hypothetical protein